MSRADAFRVLVACEFSATVRDAFRSRGFSAWSCDLLPCEGDPTWHFQDSVLHVLARDPWWDLVIAHPPCTYLTYAGAKHLYIGGRKENGRDESRWQAMRDAAEFFRTFLALPCKVAVENPIMLAAAREIVGRDYDQTIQPWQFGHGEVKRTCFWLKGLPLLQATDIVEGRVPRVHYAAPGPDRWKERSRTLPGIAAAMAQQWGDHLLGRDDLPLFSSLAA